MLLFEVLVSEERISARGFPLMLLGPNASNFPRGKGDAILCRVSEWGKFAKRNEAEKLKGFSGLGSIQCSISPNISSLLFK